MSASKQSTPSIPAAVLPDDVAYLKQMIQELLATLREQRQDNEQLRHRLDLLLRRLYGPRAERFDPNQPLLFPDCAQPPEPVPAPPPAPDDKTSAPQARRPGHGRKPLPKHLRRERIDYTLTETERVCPCCGKLRHAIGSTTTEQLDYQPASMFVVEHVQHAYACVACQGQAVRADKLPQPVEKGLPGPGLLAHVVVSKYVDHLPLYRQESILNRQGVELSRSTLCDWMAHAAERLSPLYHEMVRRVLLCELVHSDDTTVPVLDPKHEHTRKARLWVYLGDWTQPYNVFDYTVDHSQAGPLQFLKDFHGFLHADAYAGYDRIYKHQDVIEVACSAHARRKFHDARQSDPEAAHRALAYFRQLYDVEDRIRNARAEAETHASSDTDKMLFRVFWEEQVVLYRQEYAWPIWVEFHNWLLERKKQALPKSPLGEALTYALNQFRALTEYVKHGFLAIDNNWAEREMKRIATGRKNWLFAGSDNGGRTAAVLFTFGSTCQRHGLDPFIYLRDVLRRLPTHPPDKLHELLPNRWQPQQLATPPPATPILSESANHYPR